MHTTAFSLPPDAFNMAAYVLQAGALTPQKVALCVVGATEDEWTFARLEAAVGGTATGLAHLGVGAGDRILIRLGNTPDFPITYLAAILIGAIPVPLSPQLTPVEIAKTIAEIKPRAIAAADDLPLPETNVPVVAIDRLRTFHDLPAAAAVLGDPHRPAYIVYTSGTSGQSRAVVHAHRAVWARRMMWDGWYGLRPDDVVLHAGAFNWTYTMGTGLMDPWAIGATALIPDASVSPDALPALLTRHRATIFAAAPGVYRRLLRADMPALPALRHGLSAGEKLPDATRRLWQAKTGTPVHEAFGMSECSTFISGSPARPAPADTLGFPQQGRQVAIVGPDGPLDAGQTGTIAVHRSDQGLMLGYLDNPIETAARFSGDWFLTGDTGFMGSDGSITYAGRSDDMMNAGGYRVSPLEVEAVLATHPDVTEVACAEVQIRTDTSVIAAFYTGTNLIDDDQLRGYAAQMLAAYKVPRVFVRVAQIPRGANNKILRRRLRDDWNTAARDPQRSDPHGQT